MIGIRALSLECLIAFTGARSPLDDEKHVAGFVGVGKLGCDVCAGTVLAVRLADKRVHRCGEVGMIEMLDEIDDVTADAAAPAIPNLFFRMDRKPVVAAALQAGANQFRTHTFQFAAALLDNALNRDVASL